jgi:hypothetical protein
MARGELRDDYDPLLTAYGIVGFVQQSLSHAAGKGADARADGGLVGGLGAVCVRGAAGEQQNTEYGAHLHVHARIPPEELHCESEIDGCVDDRGRRGAASARYRERSLLIYEPAAELDPSHAHVAGGYETV